jgi:hypothetical protein
MSEFGGAIGESLFLFIVLMHCYRLTLRDLLKIMKYETSKKGLIFIDPVKGKICRDSEPWVE